MKRLILAAFAFTLLASPAAFAGKHGSSTKQSSKEKVKVKEKKHHHEKKSNGGLVANTSLSGETFYSHERVLSMH